jgi:hypothetical protein
LATLPRTTRSARRSAPVIPAFLAGAGRDLRVGRYAVGLVWSTVIVVVGITDVAEAVTIRVLPIEIRGLRAVVAGIADPVAVRVGLILIRRHQAVVVTALSLTICTPLIACDAGTVAIVRYAICVVVAVIA